MEKLNIFVSSTCYDLSQLRADLSDFISSSGHNPILSEYNNFPVDPLKNAVDNCINVVRNNADILILIVGSRYGSITDSGKSITNTEFLTAKSKGIPIFIFIEKQTLTHHAIWKENKSVDFSKFVDSIKIFDFISEVREGANLWTFPFERASDIVFTLKNQFSYQFKESLKILSKYRLVGSDLIELDVSAEAFQKLLNKDYLYEIDFFSQVLNDEMKKVVSYKNDLKYRIHYEPKDFIFDNENISNWMLSQIAIITCLVESLAKTINVALPEFMAENGKASDLKGLFYVAKAYSKLFESIIRWTIDTRNAIVTSESEILKESLSNMTNTIIDQIWEFPIELSNQIIKAKNDHLNNSEISILIDLNLQINEVAQKLFHEELKKFEKSLTRN